MFSSNTLNTLLPGRCSTNGCPLFFGCVCVREREIERKREIDCVNLDEVNAEHKFRLWGYHTWPHVTFTFYIFFSSWDWSV